MTMMALLISRLLSYVWLSRSQYASCSGASFSTSERPWIENGKGASDIVTNGNC